MTITASLKFYDFLIIFFVGAPALTTRGFVEKDFERVAEFLDKVVKICIAVQVCDGDDGGIVMVVMAMVVMMVVVDREVRGGVWSAPLLSWSNLYAR